MSGPDYLNPDSYVPMLRMVFEQCLCCFRFNAEVWLSYAAFEKDEVPKRLLDLQFGPGQAQVSFVLSFNYRIYPTYSRL